MRNTRKRGEGKDPKETQRHNREETTARASAQAAHVEHSRRSSSGTPSVQSGGAARAARAARAAAARAAPTEVHVVPTTRTLNYDLICAQTGSPRQSTKNVGVPLCNVHMLSATRRPLCRLPPPHSSPLRSATAFAPQPHRHHGKPPIPPPAAAAPAPPLGIAAPLRPARRRRPFFSPALARPCCTRGSPRRTPRPRAAFALSSRSRPRRAALRPGRRAAPAPVALAWLPRRPLRRGAADG